MKNIMLEVKTKVRGTITGAIGELIDIEVGTNGRRYGIIKWQHGDKELKTTQELMTHLDFLVRKGALEVVR